MQIFRLDSPIMRVLSRLTDLLILNILWLLCALPIVTIGASSTALYKVSLRMIEKREGSSLFRDFFYALRAEWKPATAVWLILLIPAAILSVNLWLIFSGRLIGTAAVLILLVYPIFLSELTYCFGYVAKFESTVRITLRNALLISLANLPCSILIVALDLLPLIVFLISVPVFLRLIFLWLVLGVSSTTYLKSILLSRIFSKYSPADRGDSRP